MRSGAESSLEEDAQVDLVRPKIRDFAAEVLAQGGVTSAARRHQGRLVVVTFHRVLPEQYRDRYHIPGIVITPEELDWTITYLKRSYTIGRLDQVHVRHEAGLAPARPLLAITFDDGYADNFIYARPVLEKHGVTSTFFVPAAFIGRDRLPWYDSLGFALTPASRRTDVERGILARHELGHVAEDEPQVVIDAAKRIRPHIRQALVESLRPSRVPAWARTMNPDEIVALAAAGHEIGAHTMTHPILNACDDSSLDWELRGSKSVLERLVGHEVTSLAYPNGDQDARVLRAVRGAGYMRAVTTQWGTNERGRERLLLSRCDIDARRMRNLSGELSESNLALRLSGLHPGLR
jgi:peptidoglycan/xylan/chitin deacetylase (PgdA/CDA1 family)